MSDKDYMRQLRALEQSGLLNQAFTKPLIAKLETLEYRYDLSIVNIETMHNYFSKFKQMKQVRLNILPKIGEWTNDAIERADETTDSEFSLKERPL